MPSRTSSLWNPLPRPGLIFWGVLLWWSAYALVFATQVVWMEERQGRPISWEQALRYSFGGWMTWVPISLALYWLVSRHAIERGRLLHSSAVLMAGALLTVLLRAAYVSVTNPVFEWYGELPLPSFGEVLRTAFVNNFMMAWLVIGIAHAIVFYQRSRERDRRVAELEASLSRSRLESLRAQLNPHFLFNALNSVSEMVHRDAEQADRMLVSLALLLRESLSTGQDQQRPLREELALVRHYLGIESLRLGERLKMHWQVEDDCLELAVPALILQPLVENAIVHGIARRRVPGSLRVQARRQGAALLLEVENSTAPTNAASLGIGLGLHSTQSRLQLLYGDRASLEHGATGGETYRVRLMIPAIDASAAADAR